MTKTPIIRIFEGIDRVGKSTSINWLRNEYEEQDLKVVVLHEKTKGRITLTTKDEFETLSSTIDNFHEKSIFSLDAYAYLIQLMFENEIDVVIFDRSFLTTKTYADVNRPGSIEEVFKNVDNYYAYVQTFQRQLQRITSDVELYCFVKNSTNSKFEDDFVDERWKQTAQNLQKINDRYVVNYDNYCILSGQLFYCSLVENESYYDALPQLQKYLAK